MSHITSLHDLLVALLEDIYDAEHQLIEALPAMGNAANDEALAEALETHHDETLEHVGRLREIFHLIKSSPQRKPCKAMAGLIRESEEVLQCSGDRDVLDAALIAAVQRIEHYEIASYGTVKAFAKRLGYNDVANLLDKSLNEESNSDKKLGKLAEGGFLTRSINKDAAEA